MTTEDGMIEYQYWERSGEGKPLELTHKEHEIVDANSDE